MCIHRLRLLLRDKDCCSSHRGTLLSNHNAPCSAYSDNFDNLEILGFHEYLFGEDYPDITEADGIVKNEGPLLEKLFRRGKLCCNGNIFI